METDGNMKKEAKEEMKGEKYAGCKQLQRSSKCLKKKKNMMKIKAIGQ